MAEFPLQYVMDMRRTAPLCPGYQEMCPSAATILPWCSGAWRRASDSAEPSKRRKSRRQSQRCHDSRVAPNNLPAVLGATIGSATEISGFADVAENAPSMVLPERKDTAAGDPFDGFSSHEHLFDISEIAGRRENEPWRAADERARGTPPAKTRSGASEMSMKNVLLSIRIFCLCSSLEQTTFRLAPASRRSCFPIGGRLRGGAFSPWLGSREHLVGIA